MRFPRSGSSLLLLSALTLSAARAQQPVTTPEAFFGFQLGADRKMARWDKIVDYYNTIEKQSGGKMKVINMGPTENENPFLMVIISSPKNMANLEAIRKANLTLVHPGNTPEAEIKKIVATGKIVIVQSMSMHATEIGGTQMAPELAYDLLTRKDEEPSASSTTSYSSRSPASTPTARSWSPTTTTPPSAPPTKAPTIPLSTPSTSATTTTATPS